MPNRCKNLFSTIISTTDKNFTKHISVKNCSVKNFAKSISNGQKYFVSFSGNVYNKFISFKERRPSNLNGNNQNICRRKCVRIKAPVHQVLCSRWPGCLLLALHWFSVDWLSYVRSAWKTLHNFFNTTFVIC